MADRGAPGAGGAAGAMSGAGSQRGSAVPSLLQPASSSLSPAPQIASGQPPLQQQQQPLLLPPSSSLSQPAVFGSGGPSVAGGLGGGAVLPTGSGSAAGGRLVQMNLYATWEVDLSSPSCVPSYFQKIPPEAPQLELKANYGLVEPIPFEFPAVHIHWTPESLAAFDLTKRPKEDSAKPKPEEEVKPLKEPDVKPQKDTGCQIS